MDKEKTFKEYEDYFLASGLPSFIKGYKPSVALFWRSTVVLTLVWLLEAFTLIDFSESTGNNLLAILITAFLLCVTNYFIRKRNKNKETSFIGGVEALLFIFLPTILILLFGRSELWAYSFIFINSLILILIYLGIGYGGFSILWWTLKRIPLSIRSSFALLSRAVPLLLVFSLLIFLTTEIWEIVSKLPFVTLLTLIALFIISGLVFLIARLPEEIEALEDELIEEELAESKDASLTRKEKFNVSLVFLAGHSLQVLIVSLAVGIFFILIGLLALDQETISRWSDGQLHVLLTLPVPGKEAYLTSELLRVCGLLASFTGLYFAIMTLTDELYRKAFMNELVNELRWAFIYRLQYLRLKKKED